MKGRTLLLLLSSCLHCGLQEESCQPSQEYITFLQTGVRLPIEQLIDGVLDGTKLGVGMEEMLTSAMKAVIQVRGTLVQRLGDMRRGKVLPCEGDSVRETETVKDVKIRITQVLDQSMRVKRMSVSAVRRMTTDLLRIKLILDKEIMRLMMIPEEEEKDEVELCQEIKKVITNLDDVTACDEMQMNEVDVDGAGGVDCFSWQYLMDDLAELSEKVDTAIEEVFADLHSTVTVDERAENIISLRRLDTVRVGLETILRDVKTMRGSVGVGGVSRNVRKLYGLCQGSEESVSESLVNCPSAEYAQGMLYVDSIDDIVKSSKVALGDIEEMRKTVMLGLIEVQRQLEDRVVFLFSSELCCLEEMEAVKGPLMQKVTACMQTVTDPTTDRAVMLDCILELRGVVETRRTGLLESQVTGSWNGTDRNCPCSCKKAARKGICLASCEEYVGVEECCACSQDCRLAAGRGQCPQECQVWGHGACCHRTCQERCSIAGLCPDDCRAGKDVTVTEPGVGDTQEETETEGTTLSEETTVETSTLPSNTTVSSVGNSTSTTSDITGNYNSTASTTTVNDIPTISTTEVNDSPTTSTTKENDSTTSNTKVNNSSTTLTTTDNENPISTSTMNDGPTQSTISDNNSPTTSTTTKYDNPTSTTTDHESPTTSTTTEDENPTVTTSYNDSPTPSMTTENDSPTSTKTDIDSPTTSTTTEDDNHITPNTSPSSVLSSTITAVSIQTPPPLTAPDTTDPISPVVMMMDASFNFSLTASDLCFHEIADMAGERIGSYSFVSPEGVVVEVRYTAGREGFVILNPEDLPDSLPFSLCSPQHPAVQDRPQSPPPVGYLPPSPQDTTSALPSPSVLPSPSAVPSPPQTPSSATPPSPQTPPPALTPACPPACRLSLPWQPCPPACSAYPAPPPCCSPPCPAKCGRARQGRQCWAYTRVKECLHVPGCCPEHFDVVFGAGAFFQEGR